MLIPDLHRRYEIHDIGLTSYHYKPDSAIKKALIPYIWKSGPNIQYMRQIRRCKPPDTGSGKDAEAV